MQRSLDSAVVFPLCRHRLGHALWVQDEATEIERDEVVFISSGPAFTPLRPLNRSPPKNQPWLIWLKKRWGREDGRHEGMPEQQEADGANACSRIQVGSGVRRGGAFAPQRTLRYSFHCAQVALFILEGDAPKTEVYISKSLRRGIHGSLGCNSACFGAGLPPLESVTNLRRKHVADQIGAGINGKKGAVTNGTDDNIVM